MANVSVSSTVAITTDILSKPNTKPNTSRDS